MPLCCCRLTPPAPTAIPPPTQAERQLPEVPRGAHAPAGLHRGLDRRYHQGTWAGRALHACAEPLLLNCHSIPPSHLAPPHSAATPASADAELRRRVQGAVPARHRIKPRQRGRPLPAGHAALLLPAARPGPAILAVRMLCRRRCMGGLHALLAGGSRREGAPARGAAVPAVAQVEAELLAVHFVSSPLQV